MQYRKEQDFVYEGANASLRYLYDSLNDLRLVRYQLDQAGEAVKAAKGAFTEKDFSQRLTKVTVKDLSEVGPLLAKQQFRRSEYGRARRLLRHLYDGAAPLYMTVFAAASDLRRIASEMGVNDDAAAVACATNGTVDAAAVHSALWAVLQVADLRGTSLEKHLETSYGRYLNEDWSLGNAEPALKQRLNLIGLKGWTETVPMRSAIPLEMQLFPGDTNHVEPLAIHVRHLIDQLIEHRKTVAQLRYIQSGKLELDAREYGGYRLAEKLAQYPDLVAECDTFAKSCRKLLRDLQHEIEEEAPRVRDVEEVREERAQNPLDFGSLDEICVKGEYNVHGAVAVYAELRQMRDESQRLVAQAGEKKSEPFLSFCRTSRDKFDAYMRTVFPPSVPELVAAEPDVSKQVQIVLLHKCDAEIKREVFTRMLGDGEDIVSILALMHVLNAGRLDDESKEVLRSLLNYDLSSRAPPFAVSAHHLMRLARMSSVETLAFGLCAGDEEALTDLLDKVDGLLLLWGVRTIQPEPSFQDPEQGLE